MACWRLAQDARGVVRDSGESWQIGVVGVRWYRRGQRAGPRVPRLLNSALIDKTSPIHRQAVMAMFTNHSVTASSAGLPASA